MAISNSQKPPRLFFLQDHPKQYHDFFVFSFGFVFCMNCAIAICETKYMTKVSVMQACPPLFCFSFSQNTERKVRWELNQEISVLVFSRSVLSHKSQGSVYHRLIQVTNSESCPKVNLLKTILRTYSAVFAILHNVMFYVLSAYHGDREVPSFGNCKMYLIIFKFHHIASLFTIQGIVQWKARASLIQWLQC